MFLGSCLFWQSVAVEEVSDGLVVLSLGFVGPTVHGQRELLFGSRGAALGLGVTLLDEGLDVGVVVFFHTITIHPFEDPRGKGRPVCKLTLK